MEQQMQQHAKVERFLKLGYSHSDILRVLESLRHDAQTNEILEELIKTCHTHSGDTSHPKSPKLVSRGCSPALGAPRPGPDREPVADFRPVVIDGSNVAMSHGNKKVFSCQGLHLAVSWFWDKGLRDITVFVPLWRKEQPRPEAPITDQHVLHELERRKILVYTPSRCVNGKRVVCYDDRYIVKLAFDSDGIVVSNDNYRDLQTENPQWKKFIEERLLMYTFANDKFMPPDDPLGRNGPGIDDFMRKKSWTPDNKLQHCPYGKKCTYGVKCKFYHPERANQSHMSVADELRGLRDRAKNFSPNLSLQDTHCRPAAYQPLLRYTSSNPPPPRSFEDQTHRASPIEQFVCPSPEADEAFGSMEGSMSRLYIEDDPYSPSHSYSSGVASYSLGHDDYSGSFGGNNQTPCLGREGHYLTQNGTTPCQRPACSQCRCCLRRPCHYQHHPAWGSCPALPPHNGERPGRFSEQFMRQPSYEQSHSLPRDPWAHSGDNSPCSEQRKGLRSQLSNLFPQSTVEQVMNAYPHISDMRELIVLIQSYRNSHITI